MKMRKMYDVAELRRLPKGTAIPLDANFDFVAMLNKALACDDFIGACEQFRTERLFGTISVADAHGVVVLKVTAISGLLTNASAYDIIRYKPKMPFSVITERSIMNPVLLKPKKGPKNGMQGEKEA